MKEAATRGFDDASCDLYKQVMIKTAWLAEKDLPGELFPAFVRTILLLDYFLKAPIVT